MERCHGVTLRRGANTRCKHMTARGTLCHQHLKADKALRIADYSEDGRPYRLYTTELIPEGGIICQFTGDTIVSPDRSYGNPYAVQVKERPRTFIDASNTNTGEARYARETRKHNSTLRYDAKQNKLHLVADRDIEPHEEITCDREVIKRYSGLPEREEPAPAPKRKATKKKAVKKAEPKPKLSKQDRLDMRYEKVLINRLLTIQAVLNDEKVAHMVGQPVKQRTVTVPKKGDSTIDGWHKRMEAKLKEQEKRLFEYYKKSGKPVSREKILNTLDVLEKLDPIKYDRAQYL